ncbi:hypothetical protein LINGRAHAP2_LOCUS32911, partial [Linum grandiflorum]
MKHLSLSLFLQVYYHNANWDLPSVQPLSGDCRINEDVDSCFCLIEIDDKQLNALVSLVFSLSYASPFGSAVIFNDSGSMQLHTDPEYRLHQLRDTV